MVVFHADADAVVSEPSQNIVDVESIARLRVCGALEARDVVGAELGVLLARFVPIHPYYETEAWLFQNTAVLRRLCAEHPELCARIDAWEADRTLLDGVRKPKAEMPFRAGHNQNLAEDGFPAEAVFAAERSFHDAVLTLDRCAAVRAGLAATYALERHM